MSLYTDAINRVPSDILLSVSRYRTPDATAPDLTWIGYIANDAEGEFQARVGIEYNSADKQHTSAGIQLFLAICFEYTTQKSELTDELRERANARCAELRGQIGAGARISVKTSSYLTPSEQPGEDGTIARPKMDNDIFSAVTLNPPSR